MIKRIFKLRNVAAIVACLAVMAIFSGCGKDDEKGDYSIEYRPGTHISGDNHSQVKTAGKDVTLRGVTYTRNGFTQTGWSKKEDGSTKDYKLKGTYTDDADITLYPFWVEGNVDPDDDDGDDDDDGKEYNLPTNVKFISVSEGLGPKMTHTIIKIGENYYRKYEWHMDFPNIDVVDERYMKKNSNGTWSHYCKDNIAEPYGWHLYSSEPLTKAQKDFDVESDFIISVLWGDVSNGVQGGTETIAGVLTNIYTITHDSWSITLYRDPITKLFFKIVDSNAGTTEVTSWNTSVTSFGGIDLP
jgi:hypothetical protein